MADIPSRSAQGFPGLCSDDFERIGGNGALDRTHQGHAKDLAAIQFMEAAVALPKRISGKGRRLLVHNEISTTLQLESGDHSTLAHPGTGMQAESLEESQCCIRVFQAADSGRLLCERDQKNAHADDLQI